MRKEASGEMNLKAGKVPRQVSMGGKTRLPLPAQTAEGDDHPTFRNCGLLKAAREGDDAVVRELLHPPRVRDEAAPAVSTTLLLCCCEW